MTRAVALRRIVRLTRPKVHHSAILHQLHALALRPVPNLLDRPLLEKQLKVFMFCENFALGIDIYVFLICQTWHYFRCLKLNPRSHGLFWSKLSLFMSSWIILDCCLFRNHYKTLRQLFGDILSSPLSVVILRKQRKKV